MVLLEKAPAKITLSLDVLGKRTDGFHEVKMIMTSVDLTDILELHERHRDVIDVSADSQYVPDDERNLAYKAAAAFKQQYHLTKGVRINIKKNIPVAAGLGGGSSDAAAVLRGLNQMWSVGASRAELTQLGARLGSDVPFCMTGTTALGTGRGEVIHPLPSPPACYVVLAKPDMGISTRHVFPRLNLNNLKHQPTADVIRSLEEANFRNLCDSVGNTLEPVTFSMHPEVARVKEKMLANGAAGAVMSGSGPVIAGLVRPFSRARRVYNGLRGFCDAVYIVRLLDQR
ncbi:4-(cytidine 5'-diphospho)-2-C-methyl-D-erythritol kinase [Lentibacillus halophilus]|uniref:4-diphosphocytidyl-2-C-methyl-D-erythritol kinase n=1 Tax=Lentibacillus halophilus TaxID=295065 RepID=A0ABP3J4V4_9BACI